MNNALAVEDRHSAFSNGSPPHAFMHHLAKRQPLSAPDGIRRYFLAHAEAGELCLLMALLENTREVFLPALTHPATPSDGRGGKAQLGILRPHSRALPRRGSGQAKPASQTGKTARVAVLGRCVGYQRRKEVRRIRVSRRFFLANTERWLYLPPGTVLRRRLMIDAWSMQLLRCILARYPRHIVTLLGRSLSWSGNVMTISSLRFGPFARDDDGPSDSCSLQSRPPLF
jgi:hypothetical protein